MRTATDYLREAFRSEDVGAGHVGTLISALTRLVHLTRALGGTVADHDEHFKPLWRLLRSWRLAVPAEFRRPVEVRLALALASYFWVCGPARLCWLVLLGFHCLLRPGEASGLSHDDVVIFDNSQVARYPDCYGVVRIAKAKTARNPSHSPVQFVLIEDGVLAASLRHHFRRACNGTVLWPHGDVTLRRHWRRGLTALGIEDDLVAPSGLRGGGATDYFLRHRNVPSLRRRGRWSNERTLERYVQEAVYALTENAVSVNALSRVSALAGLLPDLIQPPELNQ